MPTLRERFEVKVLRAGPDECWLWTAARNRYGYGKISVGHGQVRGAHVVALQLAGIEVLPGLMVLHRCDNPPCVNPRHLFVGTQTDNMQDAARKGRTVNRSDWRGARNPRAKLSAEQRASFEREIAAGERTSVLARRYGITPTRVCQIRQELRR